MCSCSVENGTASSLGMPTASQWSLRVFAFAAATSGPLVTVQPSKPCICTLSSSNCSSIMMTSYLRSTTFAVVRCWLVSAPAGKKKASGPLSVRT